MAHTPAAQCDVLGTGSPYWSRSSTANSRLRTHASFCLAKLLPIPMQPRPTTPKHQPLLVSPPSKYEATQNPIDHLSLRLLCSHQSVSPNFQSPVWWPIVGQHSCPTHRIRRESRTQSTMRHTLQPHDQTFLLASFQTIVLSRALRPSVPRHRRSQSHLATALPHRSSVVRPTHLFPLHQYRSQSTSPCATALAPIGSLVLLSLQ